MATVGRLVILDMSTYCIECAPTDGEARRLWGAAPFDDGDLIKVAPIDTAWAEAHDASCRNCERRLADVEVRIN